MLWLKDIIGSYRQGRTTPSLTAEELEVKRKLEGIHGVIARYLVAAKFRPVGEAAAETSEYLTKGARFKRTNKLVETLLNPEYDEAMDIIRSISPKDARGARIMEQILIHAEESDSETLSQNEAPLEPDLGEPKKRPDLVLAGQP